MIKSMTGFVSKRKIIPGRGEILINIRSLNFKYLDIHISRLPEDLEEIERFIHEDVLRRVKRGRIEVSIISVSADKRESPSSAGTAGVKKLFRTALRELEEFKLKQGQVIHSELEKITRKLIKRSAIFQGHIKKQPSDSQVLEKDIFEEVSLITFYLRHLEKILKRRESRIGKFLDFLSQEMLRESNTILAKLKDRELCLQAIYFKEEIDRVRELAQNIE